MIFDKIEHKLVDLVKRHLKITNEIAHTDEHLDLITLVSYDGKIIFSHKLDLNGLYEIFRDRMEQESFYAKIEEELSDEQFLSDIDSHIASLERDTSLDDIG